MEPSKVVQRLLNARPVNLPGHKNRINTVAWSSNGSYLATGSDSNLKIFTVEQDGYCKEVASFTGRLLIHVKRKRRHLGLYRSYRGNYKLLLEPKE